MQTNIYHHPATNIHLRLTNLHIKDEYNKPKIAYNLFWTNPNNRQDKKVIFSGDDFYPGIFMNPTGKQAAADCLFFLTVDADALQPNYFPNIYTSPAYKYTPLQLEFLRNTEIQNEITLFIEKYGSK